MDSPLTFGEWLKCRRKELDLTQDELAEQASCSVFAVRKIEAGYRRPSKQLAGMLVKPLDIPSKDQEMFIKVARGELNVERLAGLARASSPDSQAGGKNAPLPGKLPAALTPFIGREPELAALAGLLRDPRCRLVTLIGPGGIGKSRLAVQAAGDWDLSHTGRAFYVSLAPLSSPEFIVAAMVEALGLVCSGPGDPKTQLLSSLRTAQPGTLILLDNFEHLLEGADLLVEVLHGAPGVKLLVTSRERLNLQGEWAFDLHGLPAPPESPGKQIEQYTAVKLFVQTAQRLQRDFSLSEMNRAEVARICRLVEGMPLAIELAAAWTPMLSCREIVQEVERSLDFLSTSQRDVPARHRSLRAVFEHSWHLLSETEQRVLCQLTVFRGGFTREAAEQVAGATLVVLSSLVSKSLVRRDAEGRYDMHELLRQYAAAPLNADPAECEAARERHYAFCLGLAEAARAQIRGPEQSRWLERMEADHDNIRAALAWSTGPDHGTAGRGLRLCAALAYFWDMHGHAGEGRRWLQAALELPAPSSTGERPRAGLEWEAYAPLRAKALVASGGLTSLQGDYEAARSYQREALLLCRQMGNQAYTATCLMNLGSTEIHLGNDDEARLLYEQALALQRELGDRRGIGVVLVNMGFAAMNRGDYPAARAILLECLAIRRELGDRYGIALALGNLGAIAIEQQDYPNAQALLEESLQIRREIGDERGIAYCLVRFAKLERIRGNIPKASSLCREGLILNCKVGDKQAVASTLQERAELYASMGRVVPAVRLWSAAEMLCQSLRAPIPPSYRSHYEQALARAREEAGEGTFRQAWEEGRAMSFDKAIDSVLSDSED